MVFVALGLGLDQWTKAVARVMIAPHQMYPLTGFLSFVHVWNPGVSFGLLACRGSVQCWILIAKSLTLMIILGFMYMRAKTRLQVWGLIAILAGATSNVWDRIQFGAVFDFILVHAGAWAFPAFNVADMLISMGFLTLMCDLFQWRALGSRTPMR